jgi:hypothetical protein
MPQGPRRRRSKSSKWSFERIRWQDEDVGSSFAAPVARTNKSPPYGGLLLSPLTMRGGLRPHSQSR